MIEIIRERGGHIRIGSIDNANDTYTFKVFYDSTLLIAEKRHVDQVSDHYLEELKEKGERLLNKLSLEPKPEYMRGFRLDDEDLVYYLSNNLKNAEGLKDADIEALREIYLQQTTAADFIGTSEEDFSAFIRWLEEEHGFYFLQELNDVYVFNRPLPQGVIQDAGERRFTEKASKSAERAATQ